MTEGPFCRIVSCRVEDAHCEELEEHLPRSWQMSFAHTVRVQNVWSCRVRAHLALVSLEVESLHPFLERGRNEDHYVTQIMTVEEMKFDEPG